VHLWTVLNPEVQHRHGDQTAQDIDKIKSLLESLKNILHVFEVSHACLPSSRVRLRHLKAS